MHTSKIKRRVIPLSENAFLIESLKNKTLKFIKESDVELFISKMLDTDKGSIRFLAIGSEVELHYEPSVEDFYLKYLAGGANVLLSSQSDIALEDSLVNGFYVRISDPFVFARFVTNDNVILGGITIDYRYDKNYLKQCLRLVAQSLYTKNKKIAFAPNLNNRILYNTKKQFEEVESIVTNLRSLL